MLTVSEGTRCHGDFILWLCLTSAGGAQQGANSAWVLPALIHPCFLRAPQAQTSDFAGRHWGDENKCPSTRWFIYWPSWATISHTQALGWGLETAGSRQPKGRRAAVQLALQSVSMLLPSREQVWWVTGSHSLSQVTPRVLCDCVH